MDNNMYTYSLPRPSVMAECVLFSHDNGRSKVLLIKRKSDSFEGHWTFPGGLLKEGESAENCAMRELEDQTGMKGVSMRQLHTFSASGRESGGWTVTIALGAVVPFQYVKGADDAVQAAWFDVDGVPPLAFSHEEILRVALQEVEGISCATNDQVFFQRTMDKLSDVLGQIRRSAHELHAEVGQTYDDQHPYGYHLDMVADSVRRYGHYVCADEHDVLPLLFGAYYHDSIEDARLTYNDVTAIARKWMDDRQTHLAVEIVYALTNDKGRNRSERAGENYYRGIRETPYAPFVKLSDRLANISYSFQNGNESNSHMKEVYRRELPHFLNAIASPYAAVDKRYSLPEEMVERMKNA